MLDDWVAALDDLDVAGVVKLWPAVIAQGRDVCEACEHIHFGQRHRALPDSLGLACDCRPQFRKEPALNFNNLLLGINDLGFLLFQFRRGEPFCVDQRLLALIVARHLVQFGVGVFEVFAED